MVSEERDSGIYHLKKVTVNEKDRTIVMQNENGPCPLLAIANILLLKGELAFDFNESFVSHANLVSMVAESLLDRYRGVADENTRQNVSDAISVLPEIAKGLDVNVKFRNVGDFEYTKQCAIFDLFGISLVHGWLINKDDLPLAEYVGSKSYNQLVEELISSGIHDDQRLKSSTARQHSAQGSVFASPCSSSSVECLMKVSDQPGHNIQDTKISISVQEDNYVKVGMQENLGEVEIKLTEKIQDDLLPVDRLAYEDNSTHERAWAIDQFLKSSSQLTYTGLIQLHELLEEDCFDVLFRNNHFSTITKHKNQLYVLVTDQGYAGNLGVVWEGLEEVDGDSKLYKGDFSLWEPTANDGTRMFATENAIPDESADYALAVALQEEENERIQAVAAAESEGMGNRIPSQSTGLQDGTPTGDNGIEQRHHRSTRGRGHVPAQRADRRGGEGHPREKSKCVIM